MDFIDTLHIAGSGLTGQRVRLQAVASNMANARTTRTPEGGPYQRQVPVFQAAQVRDFGCHGMVSRCICNISVKS